MNSLNSDGKDIDRFTLISPYFEDMEKLNIGIPQPESFNTDSFNSKYRHYNGLFMLSLNCCSLLSKLDDIRSNLNYLDKKPDVVCLQEIFHIPDDLDLGFQGYNFFSKQRSLGKGGGVGFIVSDRYQTEILDSPFIENIFESIIIKIKDNDSSYIIANFYRPPKSNADTFFHTYSDFLEYVSSFNLPTFIFCDSNIDILKKDKNSLNLINSSLSFGFVNYINQATRVIFPSASGLDQAFSNKPDIVSSSGILVDSPSDHFFTYIIIKTDSVKYQRFSMHRNYSEKKISSFIEELKCTDWSEICLSQDANNATDLFLDIFLKLFNIFFPTVTKSNNRNKHFISPWFTKGLLVSRARKLKLYKNWKILGTDESKYKFNSYRNLFNKLCRTAKRLHYSKELFKAKRNSHNRWSIIKEAAGISTKSTVNIHQIKDIDGNPISDSVNIANHFNKYFASVGKKTSNLAQNSSTDFRSFLSYKSKSFALFPIGS